MRDAPWEHDRFLGVLCWCEGSIVGVTREMLKSGKTLPCKKVACIRIAEKHGYVPQKRNRGLQASLAVQEMWFDIPGHRQDS